MIIIVLFGLFQLVFIHVIIIILTEFQIVDKISLIKTLMDLISLMDSNVVMFTNLMD